MKTVLLALITILALNSYSQNVTIPDANFKAYLVGNASINTNADAEIQVSEANAYAGTILVGGNSISDLTGIEAFTSLTSLYCQGNQLTSLDLSLNTALISLTCVMNQLTSLDVSQNIALTTLNCGENPLALLDVSQNIVLANLNCYNSLLTSLDVSLNTALTSLYIPSNELICLNVKNGNNNNLNNFDASSNPNLSCIQVDDVSYSNSAWTNIDPVSSFNTACGGPCAVGIEELNNTSKQLLKIVDLMGRETTYKPNTPLIYMYSDGTVERVFTVED